MYEFQKKIKNFYVFSSNIVLLEELIQLGRIKAIFIEIKHLNQDVYNFSMLWDIPLYVADSLDQFINYFNTVQYSNSIGISFGTGFIFKSEHIARFQYGILNFHTGKLPQNRGRHPIAWSFYNCDKYFYLTAHLINEQIDQGIFIYEDKVFRSIEDDTELISKKLEQLIKNSFLINALNKLIENSYCLQLEKGKYNPPANTVFKNISSKDVTANQIFSIFKSQKTYGSVFVDGKEYIDCDFYCEALSYKGKYDILNLHGIKIILYK